MIEEGSKRGKALVEKRQLFMEMSECSAGGVFVRCLARAAQLLPLKCWRECLNALPVSCKRAKFWSHEADQQINSQFFFFSVCASLLAGAQNFDVIRLSTYRTACKLRFVQKRCNRESMWSDFIISSCLR